MAQGTLSVRVPHELKRKLQRHGIPAAEVVRQALEDAVRRREEAELDATLKKAARRTHRKVKRAEIVRVIRESRDER